MDAFKGLCANCGAMLLFRAAIENREVTGEVLAQCIKEEDLADVLIQEDDANTILVYWCHNGDGKLTDHDRDILEDNFATILAIDTASVLPEEGCAR